MEFFAENKLRAVYESYKQGVALQHTVRSGFARCGIYPQTANYPGDRPESVAEHSYSLALLVLEMSVHFPGLIPANKLTKALRLALYHDAPEGVLGDVPDNGDRDENAKDQSEYEAMETTILQYWPRKDRRALLSEYRDFQNKNGGLVQLIYALDKVEAVLRAFQYETAGYMGSVYNDPNISNLDKHYAEIVHSGNIVDVWSYHTLDRTAHLDRIYFTLVFDLLTLAFTDIRGAVPGWFSDHYYEILAERARHNSEPHN